MTHDDFAATIKTLLPRLNEGGYTCKVEPGPQTTTGTAVALAISGSACLFTVRIWPHPPNECTYTWGPKMEGLPPNLPQTPPRKGRLSARDDEELLTELTTLLSTLRGNFAALPAGGYE